MILLEGITDNHINTLSRREIEILATKVGKYVEDFVDDRYVHLTDDFKIITKERYLKNEYKEIDEKEFENKKRIYKEYCKKLNIIADRTGVKKTTLYQKIHRTKFENYIKVHGEKIPVISEKELEIFIDYIKNHKERFSILQFVCPSEINSVFDKFILINEITKHKKIRQVLRNKKYSIKLYGRRFIYRENLPKVLKMIKKRFGDEIYEKEILV